MTMRLLAVLVFLPSLAAAYGGNYGVHCSAAEKRAKKKGCEPVAIHPTQGPVDPAALGGSAPPPNPAAGGPPGQATAMPPGAPPIDPKALAADPGAITKALGGLGQTPVGPDGKCPDGSAPVPGLNGAKSCVPGMGAKK